MPLTLGTRLGSYDIVAPLGAGGWERSPERRTSVSAGKSHSRCCPKAWRPTTNEQMIALARAGRNLKELAKEFEPSEQTIRHWVFQAEADQGARPRVLPTDERAELARPRRENRQRKVERDILRKGVCPRVS